MKYKLRKLIAMLTVLGMAFSTGIVVYPETIENPIESEIIEVIEEPEEIEEQEEVVEELEEVEEQEEVEKSEEREEHEEVVEESEEMEKQEEVIEEPGEVEGQEEVEEPEEVETIEEVQIDVSYEIHYLLKDTEAIVPGLEVVLGKGSVGDEVAILYPEVEGYRPIKEQEKSFILAVDVEVNIIKIYYDIVDIDEDLDGLGGAVYLDSSPELFYPRAMTPLGLMGSMMRSAERSAYPGDHDNIEPPEPGSLSLSKTAEAVAGTNNRWKVTLDITGKDLAKTSDVVLVIDRSGSMQGGKLASAKASAKTFVEQLFNHDNSFARIALVSYAQDVTVAKGGDGFYDFSQKNLLETAINNLSENGGTHTQAALRQARILLDASTADNKVIILLSDGEPTYSYAIQNVNSKLNNTYFYKDGKRWYNKTSLGQGDYNYSSSVGDGSNLTQKIDSSYYYHNGNSAVAEAGYAKDKDYTIYAIGLELETNGQDIMDRIASPGKSYASTSSNLSSIYNEIAGSISYAATNAVIIDPMGDMFNIPGINSSNYNSKIHVDRGTIAWNDATETITWTLGTVSAASPAKMWYEVEIENTAQGGVVYPTNKHTYVNYDNALDKKAEKSFDVPEVGVNAGTIRIHYYRVNANGEPINSMGVVVAKEDAELQALTFQEGISLALNTPYIVDGPNDLMIAGMSYMYNPNSVSHGGNTKPSDVTLTPLASSVHIWFGYRNVEVGPAIEVAGYEGVYDGVNHSITVTGLGLEDTIYYSVDSGMTWQTTLPTYKNVGEYQVKVKVTNPSYEDRLSQGTIKITPRQIVLTSATASKVYDGTALINTNVAETGDGFVVGEGVNYHVTGSQTLVGESTNIFTYEWKEASKESNYHITQVQGKLTVTRADTEGLDIIGYEGEYDGLGHSIEVIGLVEGDQVYYSIDNGENWTKDNPVYTNVGEYTVAVKVTNPNYEDRGGFGLVIIKPRPVTITVANASKLYKGADPVIAGVVMGLVAEDDLGSILYMRENDNEEVGNYDKVLSANYDHNPNYTVTVVKGDFRIFALGMKISKKGEYEDSNGDGIVNVGDKIHYSITVDNVGEADLTNVWIVDEMIALDEVIENLAPGENRTFSRNYDLTQIDINRGFVVNTASAGAENLDPVRDSVTVTFDVPGPTPPTTPTTPSTPTTPTRPRTPSPDPPTPDTPDQIVLIDDDEIPLGTYTEPGEELEEELLELEDNPIPLGVPEDIGEPHNLEVSKVPQTGDNVPRALLMIIFVLSLVGTISLVVLRKKRYN